MEFIVHVQREMKGHFMAIIEMAGKKAEELEEPSELGGHKKFKILDGE